ncbi:MAG TPA: cytochrome c-type biogenesis protein [Casimicrobiaceae bacterium]|nr:cytochrome c-type biogenesis protein [Casimicrobiaceae bacterium]
MLTWLAGVVRAIVVAILFAATLALAQPADPALDARLKKLESELRCLVCQNQTLADSDASLAGDLRREVRTLAVAGKTDAEIKDYLVARYGDFVLYSPPVKTLTWLLWFGPLLLLIAGGGIWLAIVRRRRGAAADGESPDGAALREETIAKAKQMLYEEP